MISNNQAYALFVCLNLLELPYGVAVMGSRPGWCTPEVPPVHDAHKAAVAAGPKRTALERLFEAVLEFFSAWKSPRFSMLWVYLFLVQIASITAGTWFFYWYSDVLCNSGPGGTCRYEFFGLHVTSSPQTGELQQRRTIQPGSSTTNNTYIDYCMTL